MQVIPKCERCVFYAHDPHLVCVVHPLGVSGESCIGFQENPELIGKRFVDFLGLNSSDKPTTGSQREPGISMKN